MTTIIMACRTAYQECREVKFVRAQYWACAVEIGLRVKLSQQWSVSEQLAERGEQRSDVLPAWTREERR